MEKWKVVGYRSVDFKDERGNQVTGYKLYLARQPENSNVFGLETHSLFISKAYVDYVPKENEMVVISYNRYGKVASIAPVVD